MKPFIVAQIHREICQSAKCEYLDKVNYTDPCSSCPNGHFGQYEQTGCDDTIRGLGDLVAIGIQPIASAIDKVFGTTIKTCGGCKKRQEKLNQLVPL